MISDPVTPLVIYGAGGFAREVAWLAELCHGEGRSYRVVCFVDDDETNHGRLVNDIPVKDLEYACASASGARVVGGIGDPGIRARVVQKAAAAGFGFATLIHPRVERSKWVEVGEGTVICAGTILTTNIVLGRHVQVNLDCTIGHDVVMEDYATLAPGVHVSGCVHIGAGAYVGTGANIIQGTQNNPLVIGEGAVIGAGAYVTKSVVPGATVVGLPARQTLSDRKRLS